MAHALSLPAKTTPPLPLRPGSPCRPKTTIATTVPQTPAANKHPVLQPLKHRVIRLADRGRLDDALSTLDLMARRGVPADLVTYSVLLRSCIRFRDLARGRLLHRCLLDSALPLDSVVTNSLITLYSKCGDWDAAFSIFEEMGNRRNLVSWTTMISSAAQNGMEEAAIEMFCEMLETGFSPNEFSFSSVIQACSNTKFMSVGRVVLGSVIKTGFFPWDVSVGCALIDMFAKNHDLVSARKVFDRMLDRNLVAWTLMITRYGQHGHGKEAISLFLDMVLDGFEPDRFTISSVISACTELESMKLGRQLHSLAIRNGFASDTYIGCSLVDMYAKCAVGVHSHVVKSGLASVNFVGNSLVNMYARSGRMEDAIKAFDVLYEKNIISYNAIIDGYLKNSNAEEALELLHQTESMDIGVSAFTFASLLSSAASIGMMSKGQQLHAQLLKAGFGSDKGIGNSLISMYSRCGDIEDACRVFDDMDDHNVISWTSMVTGFAKHGFANQALGLFHEMISTGAKPNEVKAKKAKETCQWLWKNALAGARGERPQQEQ
ncbi:putative Pentatricopeptide repeat-containing protein, chloroplastic [Cocos nucifera]|uniref:Putative Pentatricopeptide repeat-containing protein, chloroplastic n=1 Tax=Cocos nucifera TaxID=13894 RepID=A0A8K0MZ62_COCNU|nr:putative Pentatricopeptide repeat-containing protein, chloroplastic [Cocos nucifera]